MTATLCSRNENKLRELRAALPGWEIELLAADGFPEETGPAYVDNARAKALYGREVGEPSAYMLGEDSGLEVEALGGEPGPHSARWSERPIDDLLARLTGVHDRGARYVCELVCLVPEGGELRGTGFLAGRIAEEPAGSEGFGYDPVFIPDGQTRTVAELGNAWKSRHSHRAQAARALLAALATS